MLILIINPGSTSTKTALFDGAKKLTEEIVRHDQDELNRFDSAAEQFQYRMEGIDTWLDSLQVDPAEIEAVVGRGGPLRPLEGGSYEINDQMLADLKAAAYADHASNLGAIIAHHLGHRYGVPSLIADPVTTDNFRDVARISGILEIERKCRSHALNMKEVCRREASRIGSRLEELNFVAVHMGGGISVAALEGGLIIDVNDALLGMGPFSPDRAGALPIGPLVKLCYSGKYSEEEMLEKLSRKSGLASYTGHADLMKVETLIDEGDETAMLAFKSMAYQISKEIGAMATVLEGKFEAIVLTGGMANSKRLVDEITRHVSFLKRIAVIPGEFEMEALAAAGVRFLSGEEALKKY